MTGSTRLNSFDIRFLLAVVQSKSLWESSRMPSYELLQLASPQFYALLLIGFPTGSFILLIVVASEHLAD